MIAMDLPVLIVSIALPALALCLPRASARAFRWLEHRLRRIAAPRVPMLLVVGLLGFSIPAAITSRSDIPEPGVHDEFSYLLAGQTFSIGRLANPPHAMRVHFESMHILQEPTYGSKYPPVQGLFLALGILLGRHPVIGVWLSSGLAVAAVWWMLRAWVPSRWALLGGLLAAIHPVMLYWGQSYWGGAAAALGGALVLGACGRVLKGKLQISNTLVLGAGLAILANSRPYEGLVLTVVMAAALCVRCGGRNRPPLRLTVVRLICPLLLLLSVTTVAMGYYNTRVTGARWKMPYFVHEESYAVTPAFLFQKTKAEPQYRHRELRAFYTGWAQDFYRRQQTMAGFAADAAARLWRLAKWYWWHFTMLIPLVCLPGICRRDRQMWLAVVAGIVFALALLPQTWTQIHYAAPAFSLVILLVIQGLRHLSHARWRGQVLGRALTFGLVLVALAQAVVFVIRDAPAPGGNLVRAAIISELQQMAGNHLVIVRYTPTHDVLAEWVYNEPDIDSARVVWAREMSLDQNEALLRYFRERTIWLLEPDVWPVRLTAYPLGSIAGRPVESPDALLPPTTAPVQRFPVRIERQDWWVSH